MVLRNNPLPFGLCRTFENSIEDVPGPCTSQGTIFFRESCNQLLMVYDHTAFPRTSPHNAEKFDRTVGKTVVQILDFKEALWLQLT